ncbi:hypothetical protein AgCh_002468 [Apium graveolens]
MPESGIGLLISALITQDDLPRDLNFIEHTSKLGWKRRITKATEHPHLSIPKTEAMKSHKQYNQLINRSLMIVSGLGPGTLVGSAAFDLFPIHDVCVMVPKAGELKKISDLGVWLVEHCLQMGLAFLPLLMIILFMASPYSEREGIRARKGKSILGGSSSTLSKAISGK